MTTFHPEILWAQRSSEIDEAKNVIYLTVNLPDIHKDTMEAKLSSTGLEFKATAGVDTTKDYKFDLEFYEEIDPEKSSQKFSSRSLVYKLMKKVKKEEFWPRLTKTKAKNNFLKTDFSRWVDEDEQDTKVDADDDFNPMDMGGMGGMPGMGGMGGMPGMGGMGGMGGPGGMGDFDLEKLMAQMPKNEGAGGSAQDDDDDDDGSDDGGPPPLEDAEPTA